MQVFQNNMATQGEQPFFIRLENGCEVLTNDREQKYVLKRSMAFVEDIEQEMFSTTCYIKEDTGWLKVNNGKFFPSEEAFFDELRSSEDFSKAVREMEDLERSDV